MGGENDLIHQDVAMLIHHHPNSTPTKDYDVLFLAAE
jgi:hypothetical protein